MSAVGRMVRAVWLPLLVSVIVAGILLAAAEFSIGILTATERAQTHQGLSQLLERNAIFFRSRIDRWLGDLKLLKELAEGEIALEQSGAPGSPIRRSFESLVRSERPFSGAGIFLPDGRQVLAVGELSKVVGKPPYGPWFRDALGLEDAEALLTPHPAKGASHTILATSIRGSDGRPSGVVVLVAKADSLLGDFLAPGHGGHLTLALGAGNFLHSVNGGEWQPGTTETLPARHWGDMLYHQGPEPLQKEILGWVVAANTLWGKRASEAAPASAEALRLCEKCKLDWLLVAATPQSAVAARTDAAASGVMLLTALALVVFVPAAFLASGAFRRLATVRKQLDKTLEASPHGTLSAVRSSKGEGYEVVLMTPAATEILSDPSKPPGAPFRMPEKIASIIRQTISTGRSSISEVRLFEEPTRWVLVRTAATDRGAVLAFVDTTERRRQEDALRLSQKSLQLAARMSRIGAWAIDVKTNDLWWSQEVRRIHGVPDDYEPTVAKALDFYAPSSRERIAGLVERCVQHGEEFDGEFEVRDARGRTLWVRSIGQAERDLSTGKVARVFGTFQDITEMHASALELAESRELLSVAFWGSSLSVSDWRLDNGQFIFDKNLLALLGYQSREVKHTAAFRDSLMPEEDRSRVEAAMRAYFEEQAPHFEAEYRLRGKNGTLHWLLERSRIATVDTEKKPQRLVGIITDITRLKEAESRLARALDHEKDLVRQAQAAVDAKRDFLAMMSHEIRTPMNSILGFAEMLGSQDLTDEQDEFVKTIRESGETLLRIINDVLDYSRVESGKLHIESLPFNPRDIVSAVVSLLAPTATAKGVDLTSRIASSVPGRINGDGGRIRQVLINLAANAVKFTREGSVVVSASADLDNGLLHFSVKDTGPGIDPEKLASIFEPFTQADPGISRAHGGTGLGLSISSKLVHLMGGTISAASKLGRGSEFSFSIPLDVSKSSATEVRGPDGVPAGREFATQHPLHILVAEDDRVNAKLTRIILERLGYKPTIVPDGRAAVEAVTAKHPDLILMDLRMPNMDGVEATRAIRAFEERRSIPRAATIVAFTADVLPEGKAESIRAGMDDYITKPVSSGKIVEVLLRADHSKRGTKEILVN